MKVRHIVLDRVMVSSLAGLPVREHFCSALRQGDVLVVSSCPALNGLFSDLIDKRLVRKMEAGQEVASIRSFFSSLCGREDFLRLVDERLDAVHQLLVEGMMFSFKDNTLNDYILAIAARLSAECLCALLDHPCQTLDGRDNIVCDNSGGIPVIDWEKTSRRIHEVAVADRGMIFSGGFCKTEEGYTVSLGKGGSNLTATIAGSLLSADEIIFYSDADGIQAIPVLTYDEAAHLSADSEYAVFPPAMWPAAKNDIPLRVKSFLIPEKPGTLIVSRDKVAPSEKGGITGVSCISGLDLITVYGTGLLGSVGISSSLFGALARKGINIRFISQSSAEYSISFAIRSEDAPMACEAIRELISKVQLMTFNDLLYIDKKVSIVSVSGHRMRHVPGISGLVYGALGKAGISIIAASQGGEELSISIVVDEKDAQAAVRALGELL